MIFISRFLDKDSILDLNIKFCKRDRLPDAHADPKSLDFQRCGFDVLPTRRLRESLGIIGMQNGMVSGVADRHVVLGLAAHRARGRRLDQHALARLAGSHRITSADARK